MTSLPKFEGWQLVRRLTTCPPGWVTCIATLPWITLSTLSVSIKLVSLSARVTSVKFQKGVSLSELKTDTKTNRSDQRYLGLIKKNQSKEASSYIKLFWSILSNLKLTVAPWRLMKPFVFQRFGVLLNNLSWHDSQHKVHLSQLQTPSLGFLQILKIKFIFNIFLLPVPPFKH